MTEAELQRVVLKLARLLGWSVAHFRPARVLGKGGATAWRTPVEADGAGWPDLVLVRGGSPGRLLFRELKGDRGRLRPEQAAWLKRLVAAGQDAKVWTAAGWRAGTIEEELRR